jgi:hypothetical protein
MASGTPVALSDALARIHLFNEKADAHLSYSFVRKVFRNDHGYSLSFREQTLSVEHRGADEEATAAVSLPLRFFFQERDRISLKQMREVYETLPISDGQKEMLRQAFREHEEMLSEPLPIVFLGEQLTRWKILETVLYGDLAHANPDKRPTLEAWRKAAPFDTIIKVQYEEVLSEVIYFIAGLRHFNDEVLKQIGDSPSSGSDTNR